MVKVNVLGDFETVGSFIIYKDTLAFMIGPNHLGEKLRIVRIGGHIEKNERLIEALEREIKEEAKIKVKLIDSSTTFYKRTWEEQEYSEITNNMAWDIKPLIIIGDSSRSTALFLSYAEKEPKPSSEAAGIIFLKETDIKDICSNRTTLREFVNNGGRLIQQKELDYDMEMCAGVHLEFLNRLIEDKPDLIERYIECNMVKI